MSSRHGQQTGGSLKVPGERAGDRNNNGRRPSFSGLRLNEAINKYASTKTSAQLLLDLGATIGHIFTTVALWQLTRRDGIWVAVTTLLMITVVLQIVLAVGLLTLRFMGNEDEAIPGRAKLLNNVFFIMCALVAVLEIAIAGAEKFGLDGFVDMVNGTKVCTK